jgi:hypothetical protein
MKDNLILDLARSSNLVKSARQAGFKVWLQVEPAMADALTLIDFTMKEIWPDKE